MILTGLRIEVDDPRVVELLLKIELNLKYFTLLYPKLLDDNLSQIVDPTFGLTIMTWPKQLYGIVVERTVI